jgi:hypothetical protein
LGVAGTGEGDRCDREGATAQATAMSYVAADAMQVLPGFQKTQQPHLNLQIQPYFYQHLEQP